jgi:FAD binding domain/Berberine and berberine like
MPISRRDFIACAGIVAIGSVCRPDGLVELQADRFAQFRNKFKGTIILPGDVEYDRARAPASFNPRTDKRPWVIARCMNADDIVSALEFARTESLEVAVRSGGHDPLGASVCEGIVIDLSQMKSIVIERERATARVEPGVRTTDLNTATSSHGLAAVLGCHPSVGVAGLTLGGGLGWFLRRFGAACDNLISADVISADGKLRHASEDENADLFWALRGGGGNFGIVTSLKYQLHPVDQVLGGLIAFRSDVVPFLHFYRDFMKAAPDASVAEISIVMVNQPTILCRVCWSGNMADGDRVLRPLRQFGPPVADAISPVSYAHLTDRPRPEFSIRVFGPPPAVAPSSGITYDYWKGGTLKELKDQPIEQIASAFANSSRGMSIGIGHHMHGQICKVPNGATPLTRTSGQFTYFLDANWRNPARAEAAMAWVDESWSAMQQFSSIGYVNYLSSDSEKSVQAAYRGNYQRLVALKRKYDPANVFHLNRNIRS